MAATDVKSQQHFAEMSQKQLEIYAAELYRHFNEERLLRRELENRNKQLEQRVTELASLNKLFQKYLEDYGVLEEAYERILGVIENLAEETRGIRARTRSAKPQEMQSK